MWKVDLREVTFLGSEYNDDAYRIGNITQFFRHRTMSLVGGEPSRRAYTTIGEIKKGFERYFIDKQQKKGPNKKCLEKN
jgi:hypothetical protein